MQDEFYLLGDDSIKAIQIANSLFKRGFKLDVLEILKKYLGLDSIGYKAKS